MTTKNLIPRASGEGGIGITDVTWGYGYYDTGNFNKGLFVSGHNITQVIAETVAQGGLGGEWTKAVNGLDIYYNGGNVGIGTSIPSRKLQIHSDTAVSQTVAVTTLSNGTAISHASIGHGTDKIGNLQLGNAAGNLKVRLDAGGDSYFNGGNVGIGASNPVAKTHIENGHLLISQSSNTTQENILLQSSGYRLNSNLHGNVSIRSNYTNSTNSGSLNFYTAVTGTGTTERMRIQPNGNVGIGTSNPGVKLTTLIEDDSTYGNSAPNSVNSLLALINTPTSEAANNHATLQFNLNAGDHNHVGSISLISESATLRRGALAFCTDNGTDRPEAMRIDSAGNVGIGTTNPAQPLDVNGWVKSSVGFLGSTGRMTLQTDGVYISTNGEDAPIKFAPGTGNAEKMRILSNGNVGIGTTNTGAKLDVQGSNANGDVRLSTANTSAAEDASTLLLLGSDEYPTGSAGFRRYSSTHTKASVFDIVNFEAGKHITFSTRSGNAEEERMRILSNGNVGIGTTNPGMKLDVVGVGRFNVPAGGSSIISYSVGAATNSNQPVFALVTDETNNQERVRFNSDGDSWFNGGNVGIGTTDPDNLLHIKGDAHSKVLIQGGDSHAIGLQIKQPLAGGDQVWQLQSEAGDTALQIRNGTTNTVVQHMNANGNVGIGTTTPDANYMLDVNGNLTVSGLGRFQRNSSGAALLAEQSGGGPAALFSGGNVGIGTASPAYALEVKKEEADWVSRIYNTGSGSDSAGLIVRTDATAAHKAYVFAAHADGEYKFLVTSDGSVGIGTEDPGANKLYVNGDVFATSYTPTSDDRVKHNEQTIVGAIEILGKLTPKKYIKTTEMYDADHDFELDANGDPVDENGEPVAHAIEAGVIAQKVLEVPELAFTVSPEGVDEDGNVTSPHGLNYNSLFTYAIAAIQEQQQLIKDLRSEVEALKNK